MPHATRRTDKDRTADAPTRRSRRRSTRRRSTRDRRAVLQGIAIGVLVAQLAGAAGVPRLTLPAREKRADDVTAAATAPEAARPISILPGQPPTGGSGRSITINWVGDTVLGSSYGLPPDSASGVFRGVAGELARADLTIGNLEGTFGTGGLSKCGADPSPACFAFQAPAKNAAALRKAGFDVMNLANNHALDFGAKGQRQTIRALDRVRVLNAGRPGVITLVSVRGVRVAILGFAPYPWASSLTAIPAARAVVNRAADISDLVIVLMHAGAEGAGMLHTPDATEMQFGEDRGYARGFAHATIDGGADLVLGSGPHVVRGMEFHDRRLIAYSLGNFAGYHNFAVGGVLSLSGILKVKLGPTGKLESGRWKSVLLEPPGLPRLDPSHTAARLVGRLSREDFGSTAVRVDVKGRFGAQSR